MRRRAWVWSRASRSPSPAHRGRTLSRSGGPATTCSCAIASTATAGDRLLLVALDHLGRSDLRFGRVEAGGATRLALMEQVVALVELDLDLLESLDLGGAEAPPVTGLG